MKKKILTILGNRPQFVKAAVLSRLIKSEKYKAHFQEIIVHTQQHYDYAMNTVFFEEMKLPKPDYFLDITGETHGAMTGQMLEQLEPILLEEKPDYVLVYGDTNSTLAGALAARKLHFPIVHVEAGLRSFNTLMPEEINRILTDNMSSILCCPSENAIENLRNEGFFQANRQHHIVNTGDIMKDAVLFYQQFAQKPAFDLPSKFLLATLHRAENTDHRANLQSIFEALNTLGETQNIVLPIHPRTQKQLEIFEINIKNKNIHILPPVSYFSMLWLLQHCDLVLTDSGGLQKEAFFLQKHCITLREQTEWIELLEENHNVLTGAHKDKILSAFDFFKEKKFISPSKNLYGEGKAGEVILGILENINPSSYLNPYRLF